MIPGDTSPVGLGAAPPGCSRPELPVVGAETGKNSRGDACILIASNDHVAMVWELSVLLVLTASGKAVSRRRCAEPASAEAPSCRSARLLERRLLPPRSGSSLNAVTGRRADRIPAPERVVLGSDLCVPARPAVPLRGHDAPLGSKEGPRARRETTFGSDHAKAFLCRWHFCLLSCGCQTDSSRASAPRLQQVCGTHVLSVDCMPCTML